MDWGTKGANSRVPDASATSNSNTSARRLGGPPRPAEPSRLDSVGRIPGPSASPIAKSIELTCAQGIWTTIAPLHLDSYRTRQKVMAPSIRSLETSRGKAKRPARSAFRYMVAVQLRRPSTSTMPITTTSKTRTSSLWRRSEGERRWRDKGRGRSKRCRKFRRGAGWLARATLRTNLFHKKASSKGRPTKSMAVPSRSRKLAKRR